MQLTTPDVKDFFDRHLDDIAEAMRDPEVIHRPGCLHGKRSWIFSWRWPFVHTWISNAVCCCEIDEIMGWNRRIELGGMTPRQQKKLLREWSAYLNQLDLRDFQRMDRRLNRHIDDIVAILNALAH